MEAPPPVLSSHQRFNVTQFRRQMNMLDTTNAKFNTSFLQQSMKKHNLNDKNSPTTDLKVMINHHKVNQNSRQIENQTIADRIQY